MFFRKVVAPILNLALKKHVERINLTRNEFQAGQDLYNQGKKREALAVFESIAKKNEADKASRGMISSIRKELKDEHNNPSSNTPQPK